MSEDLLPAMKQVSEEAHGNKEENIEKDDALQQREILALNGDEQNAPNPGYGEDDFHQKGCEKDQADLVEPGLRPGVDG